MKALVEASIMCLFEYFWEDCPGDAELFCAVELLVHEVEKPVTDDKVESAEGRAFWEFPGALCGRGHVSNSTRTLGIRIWWEGRNVDDVPDSFPDWIV